MTAAHEKLNALIAEVVDLRYAAALLDWDERVCMPPGGVPAHGHMLATIRRLAHEKFTSRELGDALEAALREGDVLPADSASSRMLRVAVRDHRKATRVPGDYVSEHARVASAAHQAWKQAREASDHAIFLPHLERIVRLKQAYASFFAPLGHPYDALLDDYEPGMRTAEIQTIFDELRPPQVELVRAIGRAPAVEDGVLRAAYDEGEMLQFSAEVISRFGFDWQRGRQDLSAHPFAVPIGPDDVRITTRFDRRRPFETLFSMMHEAGHALYEQGVSPTFSRTLARGGASLGVHESQSRLWENLVGRSRPFWEHFYPRLQQRFPSQLGSVGLDAFYRAINKVSPSLIRVEADEVTYNLHVMLRVEIEIALLTGAIVPADAPAFWNEKMREYFGVMPDTAADGILQDMHWSIGVFGNFATYTLGNLISVQLWDRFKAGEPGWAEQVSRGDFGALRGWLQRMLHQHGRSYEPRELIERITGQPIETGPYLDYLHAKYGELYPHT
jgi:carboxypeptidase Taq